MNSGENDIQADRLAALVAEFFGHHSLSPRELEVCQIVVGGQCRLKDLAEKCGISENTASNHLNSIFRKMQISSKCELVSAFVEKLLEKQGLKNGHFYRPPRVLIADDEADLVDVVAEGLRDRGFKTVTTTESKNILPIVQQHAIDFIVSDIRMPKLDGVEALKDLRDRFPFHPLAVFVTGFSDYQAEDLYELGAVGVLQKPINLDALTELIEKHYIDSISDSGRSIRVPSEIDVKMADFGKASLSNIGYGGVFVKWNTAFEVPGQELRPGRTVSLEFELEPGKKPIQSVGEIAWVRPVRDGKNPAGFGVKFTEVDEESRNRIIRFVRSKKIRSFVPTGASAARV